MKKCDMIDWNKYFDHIFVISRCKNFDRRIYINEQFKYFNITNYQYWYMPDYNLNNSKIFKSGYSFIKESQKRCSMAHYMLWKTCYELNYEKILIIEDDIRFIDNQTIIKEMLDKYKNTYSDIYMFDYSKCNNSDNDAIYEYYFKGTCYALNKKGLNYLINCHEKYNIQSDNYFYKFNKNYIEITSKFFIGDNFIPMSFGIEDININLELSPKRICYQYGENYNDIK